MSKKAIYPGSFDPITNGHLDIIHRAIMHFDEIIIAIFENKAKNKLFNFDERKTLIEEAVQNIDGVTVAQSKGLLVDFAEENNSFTIIRGLRAVSDFDYEFQLAVTNRKLNKKIDTIFLMTDVSNSYLSSSMVKEIAQFNGDVSQLTPNCVKEALVKKYA